MEETEIEEKLPADGCKLNVDVHIIPLWGDVHHVTVYRTLSPPAGESFAMQQRSLGLMTDDAVRELSGKLLERLEEVHG